MRSTYHSPWCNWRERRRYLAPGMRMRHEREISRILRGMRHVPGAFSCQIQISAPLVMHAEWAYRMRRAQKANKRVI